MLRADCGGQLRMLLGAILKTRSRQVVHFARRVRPQYRQINDKFRKPIPCVGWGVAKQVPQWQLAR